MSLTKLSDLVPDTQGITNLLAVISSMTVPSKSNGNNHVVRLELVDKSFDTIVTCILFGDEDILPDTSVIPHPAIIRLRRIKVEYFQGRPQIQKGPGYSWCVFSTEENSFIPVDKSHDNAGATLSQGEKNGILELQQWIGSPQFRGTTFNKNRNDVLDAARQADQQDNNPIMDCADEQLGIPPPIKKRKFNKFNNGNTPLCHMNCDLYFNLIAVVVGVCHIEQNTCAVLRCMDGTKPARDTVHINNRFIRRNCSMAEMTRLADYYVDIMIYDSHRKKAETFKPGDTVDFTNLHIYTPVGLSKPEIILHNGTTFNRNLNKLSPDCLRAKLVLQRIAQIKLPTMNAELAPLPIDESVRSLQTSVTECLYQERDVKSLADIINHVRSNLVSTSNYEIFKARVVVDKIGTDCYLDCIKPHCMQCERFHQDPVLAQCPDCNSVLRNYLFFTLHVRDATSQSMVVCYGESARELVGMGSGEINVMGLSRLDKIIDCWSDIHLMGCEITGEIVFFLTSTIIKPEPDLI